MKFYNSIGPNPHVVRMFMAEKGLKIETTDVDLMAGGLHELAQVSSRKVRVGAWHPLDDHGVGE